MYTTVQYLTLSSTHSIFQFRISQFSMSCIHKQPDIIIIITNREKDTSSLHFLNKNKISNNLQAVKRMN